MLTSVLHRWSSIGELLLYKKYNLYIRSISININIKYIVNARIPTDRAYGYAIMKMCAEFSKAGAKLELIVPNKGYDKTKKTPFDFYGIEKLFPIKRISSFDLLAKSMKFGKLFYWLDMLSFLLHLKFSVDLGERDIVYSRDFLVALIFSIDKFICLELHDIPTKNFLFKKAVKRAKLIFVINNALKKSLIEYGVSANKIYVFPSGVDFNDFQIKETKKEAIEKLNLPQDKPLVVYTGQLYGWKGADTLALAAKNMSGANFVFVGGVEPEITIFKNKYSHTSNIIIKGSAPRKEMPVYTRASDVLVLPNSGKSKISISYTSPLKLFEYMASAKPIVASDLPSIREIVDEGDVVFFKPDDADSLALSLKKVLHDPVLANSMAQRTFQKSKNYSWLERASQILYIISKNVYL